jgi:EpsI family protein
MKDLRFWILVALLAATLLGLLSRNRREVIPASEPLSQLPRAIGGRIANDVPIDQATRDVLGAGDFLSRVYSQPGEAPVGLFVGYFPTQRTGSTIHSPKHCLPGAGWTFESSNYVDLKDDSGRFNQVGEYIVGNGEHRQFVIYWYQAHGRSVANEYIAKIFMVTDAIRLNRTDGALVRVISPINPNEEASLARARTEAFVARLAPILSHFVPD